MEEQKKVDVRNRTKIKYRLRNRFFSATGELDWPLYLTIIRINRPKQKSVQELTRDALLKVYAPAGVLVDQLGKIHYIHGHTGLYLEPAQGSYGLSNVLKMARKKLRRDLNTTLYKAVTSGAAVASPLLSLKQNGEIMGLIIRVIPIPQNASIDQDHDFYLVIFEQRPVQKVEPVFSENIAERMNPSPVSRELMRINRVIEAKEAELSSLNTALENTRRELEVSRDKLNVVKANIYASETELQTLIENIDKSKEELQILGDELIEARSEIDADIPIPETMTPEFPPVREELDTIKQDLLRANQELTQKKDELKILATENKIPAEEESYFDFEAALVPEKELDLDSCLKEAEIPDWEDGLVSEPETRDYQADLEPFEDTPPALPVNEKSMGFFSKNEPKPFFVQTATRSFENESDRVNDLADKNELVFKDAVEFQIAASHGYRHDSEIKSVSIPEGVEVIRRSMFYKCTQLEEVTLPSTLKSIEDFAFYGCEALKIIDLNQCKILEVIGTSAFEGCESMVGLMIPESLIEIEEAAFNGCQTIETVEFQENSQLEILGSHVFKDCQKIKRIVLPDKLKNIGISCFYGCDNLTEIHLPRELESVGEYAFWGCNALTEISVSNKKILKQPGFAIGFPEGIKLLTAKN